jgi:hypothetical protein
MSSLQLLYKLFSKKFWYSTEEFNYLWYKSRIHQQDTDWLTIHNVDILSILILIYIYIKINPFHFLSIPLLLLLLNPFLFFTFFLYFISLIKNILTILLNLENHLDLYAKNTVIHSNSGLVIDSNRKIRLLLPTLLINIWKIANFLGFYIIYIFFYNFNKKSYSINMKMFNKLAITLIFGFPWYYIFFILKYLKIITNFNNLTNKKPLVIPYLILLTLFFNINFAIASIIFEMGHVSEKIKISIKNFTIETNGLWDYMKTMELMLWLYKPSVYVMQIKHNNMLLKFNHQNFFDKNNILSGQLTSSSQIKVNDSFLSTNYLNDLPNDKKQYVNFFALTNSKPHLTEGYNRNVWDRNGLDNKINYTGMIVKVNVLFLFRNKAGILIHGEDKEEFIHFMENNIGYGDLAKMLENEEFRKQFLNDPNILKKFSTHSAVKNYVNLSILKSLEEYTYEDYYRIIHDNKNIGQNKIILESLDKQHDRAMTNKDIFL